MSRATMHQAEARLGWQWHEPESAPPPESTRRHQHIPALRLHEGYTQVTTLKSEHSLTGHGHMNGNAGRT